MLSALRTTLKNALETNLPKTTHRLRVLRYIHWQPHESELALVGTLIRPGTDGVDVGANTGLFSWQIARFARHCYCFEPVPHLAAYLKRALPANCTVVAAGVSDAPARRSFNSPGSVGATTNPWPLSTKPTQGNSPACVRSVSSL